MLSRHSIQTALLAASIALPAAAALADQPLPPTLTVSGDGTATAAPDIAVVSLGVVSESANARDALSANAADMTAAIAAIVSAGIEKKDIATTGLSVEPIYTDPSKDPSGKTQLTGYRVQNQVTVKVRDIANAGPLLDKVISAGANRVTGLDFQVDEADALHDQAIKAAIAEARRKATMIAAAAGVVLGPIQSITTGDGGGMPMFRAQMAMKADAPTPVMPGEQQIGANATIVYTIRPQ